MQTKKTRWMRSLSVFLIFSMLIFAEYSWAVSTGKISGQVLDKETEAPLMGANIVLEGTYLGAAVDLEGNYFIINIPPGIYNVESTMMGYATLRKEKVKVSINQTTPLDFLMEKAAVRGQTVTVTATRPLVKLDVSSSQRIITDEVIMDRPLSNLEEILASETGISLSASEDGTGLVVRGGEINETDIVVDGLSMRNERTQQPSTALNLTAINEIEVLSGGFNAEFGNIRSGMVSVSIKEGSLDRYSVNLDLRMSPSAKKHFGPNPYGTEGLFWQTYTGPDAFTGVTEEMVTNGEYPFTFIGWNEVARQFIVDHDPDNDMTPQELLEIWKWQHRVRKYADKPDYIFDGTFSGRVPFTKITFLASERYENLQLVYPLSRNNSSASTTMLKFTTYLTPKMKLSFNNIYIMRSGVAGLTEWGYQNLPSNSTGMITGTREGVDYERNTLWWRSMWDVAAHNPIDTKQYRGGLTLNHVLSTKTFYDISLQFTDYQTKQEPIALRDTTGIKKIGNNWYDEAPWGYMGSAIGPILEQYDILGDFMMSGGGSKGRDHSTYQGVTLKADLVSQINMHNQIKTGFTLGYTQLHERREINYSETTTPYEEAPWRWWYFDESPLRLEAYIQDKLEYKGMIANFGVRMDYLLPGAKQYNIDPTYIFSELPYNLDNFIAQGSSFADFTLDDKTYKLYISPRLGISHPISVTSKIFFNYGHFYQYPIYQNLYTIQPQSQGATIPNLNVEWPRTVSYEIGFEQSVANDFLVHFMGYYKDVSDQLSQQNIVSFDSENEVYTWANNSYADIRGLELRLEKRVGTWWYGWITLNYMVKSTGYTGLAYIYENRQLADLQREQTNQVMGWPVPSVTANINFRSPLNFGPKVFGINILGDWRLNILQDWSAGGKTLLNPESLLSEQHYAEEIDWWNTDMLLEKRVQIGPTRLGFFMQVKNLFNFKGFPNPRYWNNYIDSLHFPWETGDQKGNDKIGEWDKDYIDLGWNTWSHFVNPRDIYFGVRIQF